MITIYDTLKGRCVTCMHWCGDMDNFYKVWNSLYIEQIGNFLNPDNTWCSDGECKRIKDSCYVEGSIETEAVFGCILWQERISNE